MFTSNAGRSSEGMILADQDVDRGVHLWVTPLVLCFMALLAQSWANWLEFDRSAVAAGQYWRLVTGHWTHWSPEHLRWSGGTFALLAIVCWARSRRRFVAAALLSIVMIDLAVWNVTGLTYYRGLSGIDSALFVVVALMELRDLAGAKRWVEAAIVALLIVGLGAKIVFEATTGRAVFVSADPSEMVPVPLAHLAGALAGLLAVLLVDGKRRGYRSATITSPGVR